jgi:hypothetical protein
MTDPTSWLPLASLAVAIAAVIFGPIISLRVTRSKIRSDSRRQWLDTVRSKIARFTLLCSIVQENIPQNRTVKPGTIEEIRALFFELQLYLNPKKDLQKKILMDLADPNSLAGGSDFEKFGDSLVKLTTDTRELVKEVWSKIKKGL